MILKKLITLFIFIIPSILFSQSDLIGDWILSHSYLEYQFKDNDSLYKVRYTPDHSIKSIKSYGTTVKDSSIYIHRNDELVDSFTISRLNKYHLDLYSHQYLLSYQFNNVNFNKLKTAVKDFFSDKSIEISISTKDKTTREILHQGGHSQFIFNDTCLCYFNRYLLFNEEVGKMTLNLGIHSQDRKKDIHSTIDEITTEKITGTSMDGDISYIFREYKYDEPQKNDISKLLVGTWIVLDKKEKAIKERDPLKRTIYLGYPRWTIDDEFNTVFSNSTIKSNTTGSIEYISNTDNGSFVLKFNHNNKKFNRNQVEYFLSPLITIKEINDTYMIIHKCYNFFDNETFFLRKIY